VYDYLQASDIFVLPTERGAREGLSNSLLEAMACGLPVVSTPLDAMKDVVKDGKNSLMVNQGDVGSLQGALERIMSDPALAAALGQAARNTVLEKFSRQSVIKAYLNLFTELNPRQSAGSAG